MKQIASTTMLLLFTITAAIALGQPAQGPKPTLFSSLPSTISCTEAELAKVFSMAEGQSVTVAFGGNFNFNGAISSNTVKYSNLQSAVIKSPAFSNAILHLSKRINAGNGITYTGRIYNDGFGDGFELKKDGQGNYQLVKFETEKVRQTCDHH